MRVLVDTNVVLDYIAKREPYAAQAYKIVKMCTDREIDGCIAAHTVLNLFFILRKEMSVAERKATIRKLCLAFDVVGVDVLKIMSALENDSFDDFEDCIQYECAMDFGSDYLITRNVPDFTGSSIKAITPGDFLAIVDSR
jgi:predicted nucleic acid-binding protein